MSNSAYFNGEPIIILLKEVVYMCLSAFSLHSCLYVTCSQASLKISRGGLAMQASMDFLALSSMLTVFGEEGARYSS